MSILPLFVKDMPSTLISSLKAPSGRFNDSSGNFVDSGLGPSFDVGGFDDPGLFPLVPFVFDVFSTRICGILGTDVWLLIEYTSVFALPELSPIDDVICVGSRSFWSFWFAETKVGASVAGVPSGSTRCNNVAVLTRTGGSPGGVSS